MVPKMPNLLDPRKHTCLSTPAVESSRSVGLSVIDASCASTLVDEASPIPLPGTPRDSGASLQESLGDQSLLAPHSQRSGVEVRRIMLVEIHTNRDAKETADFRHFSSSYHAATPSAPRWGWTRPARRRIAGPLCSSSFLPWPGCCPRTGRSTRGCRDCGSGGRYCS